MKCDEVRRELERLGLLLLQDKELPSIATIYAGGPMAGSWWSHPRSHEMFRCLEPAAAWTKRHGVKASDRADLEKALIDFASCRPAHPSRSASKKSSRSSTRRRAS